MPPRAVLAVALLALAGPAWEQSQPSPCSTLDACLALVGTQMPEARRTALQERIESFGAAASDALVERLAHADRKVASAAGLELAQFAVIDPRHLSALIRAYEGGNVWMPRAIAATGTRDALTYLQERARQSPDFSNDNQLHMGLAKFGDRLLPFVSAELEACGLGGPAERCRGLFGTLGDIGGGYPGWAVDPVAKLARAPAAEDSVRWLASDFLIRRRHPLGLEILRERLEARSGKPWQTEEALRQLADYGPAAAELGPRVAAHLGSAADVRVQAALTLGRIGAKGEAPKLIALELLFEDDWLLGYNAVEALGRLRSAQARPLLDRTARMHWHRGVRNNARRALNSLAGRDFERPDMLDDAGPFPPPRDDNGEEYIPFRHLRYAGDVPIPCVPAHPVAAQAVSQDPPAVIGWPKLGARRLDFQPLTIGAVEAVRPALGRVWSSARIPFRMPLGGGGFLAGYDQGEWGGGVIQVRADGTSEPLIGGNAKGAFRIGKRLIVVQGLSHMMLSEGTLSVFADDPLRLVRTMRLPAEAEEIFATDRHAVLVRTPGGDLAITEDARLADPHGLGLCSKGTP